jgi:hypothetical protein
MPTSSSRIRTHFRKHNYLRVNREKPAIVLGGPPNERRGERNVPAPALHGASIAWHQLSDGDFPTIRAPLYVLQQVYSHLPNIAQTAGIVVTNPTRASVEPTAFRCSTLRRSARSSAIPAPIIARVAMMNANSGRVSWISFTQKSR